MSPALLETLLDDAALIGAPGHVGTPDPPEAAGRAAAEDRGEVAGQLESAVDRHRALADDPVNDLVTGPLIVPAGMAGAALLALDPGDHAVRLLLVPDVDGFGTGRADVAEQLRRIRDARNLFLDDDRAELIGVQVPLPTDLTATAAVRAIVDALDFTVPAWLQLRPGPGWLDALAVLAEDGAEGVAATAAGPGTLSDEELAALLRAVVDRELTVRLVGGPLPLLRPAIDHTPDLPGDAGPGHRRPDDAVPEHRRPDDAVPHGVLNVLCAVRAALNGAQTPELAAVLAETRPAPLLSALRRMSDADAVVVRAFLAAVPVAPVTDTVADLAALGLLPTDLR